MKGLLLLIIVFISFHQNMLAQSADSIINNYLEARGGIQNLNSIKTLAIESIKQLKDKTLYTRILKVDRKITRTDFVLGEDSGFAIVTKDSSWFYDTRISDKIEAMTSNKADFTWDRLDIIGPLFNYKDKGYKVALLGQEKENNNHVWKIELTNGNDEKIIFSINAKNNLLVEERQILRKKNGKDKIISVTKFKDYKDFGGVLFPLTLITENSREKSFTYKFDKIVINPVIDKSLYRPPN